MIRKVQKQVSNKEMPQKQNHSHYSEPHILIPPKLHCDMDGWTSADGLQGRAVSTAKLRV